MISIEKLEDQVEALKVADELVTVRLSRPLAWLVRDLIGLCNFGRRIGGLTGAQLEFRQDMLRLNEALGCRDTSNRPTVMRWSRRAAETLCGMEHAE